MFFVRTLSRALQPMLTLPLIRAECDQGHDRRPRLWVVTLLCQRPCLFEAKTRAPVLLSNGNPINRMLHSFMAGSGIPV